MKWETIVTKDNSTVVFPDDWLLPHYYEALNALFRIENALRVFVYIVLKSEFKEKWLDINITSDDSAQSSIGRIAKQRMNQTKRFAYLGYFVPCPLMYMTSGELIRIIVSDSYWKLFNAHFPGSKEIISNKLDEISSVRNALAHFRPIKRDDIELIKQNAKHVLSMVETCIIQLMRCSDVVPTNTQDDWYKGLKLLGTDYSRLLFNQSDDGNWIKVSFVYNCPILDHSGYEFHRRYRALNLNTPAILQNFPRLQALLILLSENTSYPFVKIEDTPDFQKSIIMVFRRDVISAEYATIKQQIDNVLMKVAEETRLLQGDNLARGKLVHAVDIIADKKRSGDYWTFDVDGFICRANENDPPEYWGQLNYVADNYITSTDQYPWMPVNVSEQIIPF